MQCSKNECGKKAVLFRKYEGAALCQMHFCQSIEHTFRKTIAKNDMIQQGDRIVSGFSGGKDSSVLLYLLAGYAKKKNFTLEAVMIDEGIANYREQSLKKAKEFSEKNGIKLTIVNVKKKKGNSIDEIAAKQKDLRPCSYCGVFRRTLLNETARKLKATKLAIGHNLDDEVQSIFTNYIRGDLARGARLGPKTPSISKDLKFIPRIKPLLEIPEKEVALYAVLKGLVADFGECPYAQHSFRWFIRDMINDMEAKYPGTKFSIKRTFDKIHPLLLEMQTKEKKKLNYCTECEEPTSASLCKSCEMTKKMFELEVDRS